MPEPAPPDPAADPTAPAPEPAPPAPPRERAGPVQWLLFVAFTFVCLLAAYLSLTGQRQLPLP